MSNPFSFIKGCFTKKIQTEQIPTELQITQPQPIIQSNLNKKRPISNRRKLSANGNGNSFKVEINLKRILSFKKDKLEQPIDNRGIKNKDLTKMEEEYSRMEDLCYRKAVAKRWRQRRDAAIQNGIPLYGGKDDIEPGLSSFFYFTNIVPYLCSIGFKNYEQKQSQSKNLRAGFILKKNNQIYLTKETFKHFFKDNYDISLFHSPFEAFILLPEDNQYEKIVVKILEKKVQIEIDGSFEHKIWSSISLKKEYEIILGESFYVEYAICLNGILELQYKNLNIRKINIINALLKENKIPLFFGEQPDYLSQIKNWTQFH